MSHAVHAPQLGVVAKTSKPADLTIFMGMADRDRIVEAIAFGEASDDQKTRDMAEMLKTGKYIRRRDQVRIPPQPGHGCMQYFWYLHGLEGPHTAYDWLGTVKDLHWFRDTWDEGRAKRLDGSLLAPLVHKTASAGNGSELAKKRAAKQARAERDRQAREAMKGASLGGGGKKSRRK